MKIFFGESRHVEAFPRLAPRVSGAPGYPGGCAWPVEWDRFRAQGHPALAAHSWWARERLARCFGNLERVRLMHFLSHYPVKSYTYDISSVMSRGERPKPEKHWRH